MFQNGQAVRRAVKSEQKPLWAPPVGGVEWPLAEKALSGALDMANIAVFHQSVSEFFIYHSPSLIHRANFDLLRNKEIYFYKEMCYGPSFL